MMLLQCFCAIFILLPRARCQDPTPAPIRPSITVSKGSVRLFSGEDLRTQCSVPADPSRPWRYSWLRDGQDMGFYNSSEAWIKHSGRYSCKAERDIPKWPYVLNTLPSLPLELHVDRGWALLQKPVTPPILDDAVKLLCRIRGNPAADEVLFYKDGTEIYSGGSQELVFSKVTLEDAGVYWCRVSWMERNELHSAQSLHVPVNILDKLETPRLEVVSGQVIAGKPVRIRCKTQLNVKVEGLQIQYYYMKNNNLLAPASSSNIYSIWQMRNHDAGVYTCKAKVRQLNLERLSNNLQLKLN